MDSVASTKQRDPSIWLRRLGWILVAVGVATMGVTLIDIAYTTSRYTADCISSNFLPDWNPCYHDSFVYLWIASGVWTSVLVVAVGFFALYISRSRQTNPGVLQFRKDALSVTCGLLATVFAPIVVILHSIEAYEGKGTFYFYSSKDNGLHYNDSAKLLLPVGIVILGFIELCACVATAYLCWRFRTVVVEDPLYYRRSSSRFAELYSRPYEGAPTWPIYGNRNGDRGDLTHYDGLKRSRLRRNRDDSVYGSYNGFVRPMASSWYAGWGYAGRSKRKHTYGYLTPPAKYPMPYVYPMPYYLPHAYATVPTPLYY